MNRKDEVPNEWPRPVHGIKSVWRLRGRSMTVPKHSASEQAPPTQIVPETAFGNEKAREKRFSPYA